MVYFVIVMVAIALLAAIGFLVSNQSPKEKESGASDEMKRYVQSKGEQAREVTADEPTNEDVVCYSPADIPAILHDALSSVPVATVEEAMMGCYGTMGTPGTTLAQRKQDVVPFQTSSLDELLTRATMEITCMESEQHIARFTVTVQKKSKTNPHVDLVAHSNEPKRVRLIRFWRVPETFIATLPN